MGRRQQSIVLRQLWSWVDTGHNVKRTKVSLWSEYFRSNLQILQISTSLVDGWLHTPLVAFVYCSLYVVHWVLQKKKSEVATWRHQANRPSPWARQKGKKKWSAWYSWAQNRTMFWWWDKQLKQSWRANQMTLALSFLINRLRLKPPRPSCGDV